MSHRRARRPGAEPGTSRADTRCSAPAQRLRGRSSMWPSSCSWVASPYEHLDERPKKRSTKVKRQALWLSCVVGAMAEIRCSELNSVLQPLQNHRPKLRHAASSQRKNHVTRLGKRRDLFGGIGKSRSVFRSAAPRSSDSLGKSFGRDAFD